MFDQTTKWCPICRRQTLWARRRPNHVLHLLLTLTTCGLWLIIWFLLSIRFGGWRCQTCGVQSSPQVNLLLIAICCYFGLVFLGFWGLMCTPVTPPPSPPAPQQSVHVAPSEPVSKPESTTKAPERTAQKTESEPTERTPKVFKEGETVHVGYTSYCVWRSWWSNRLSQNEFLNQRPNAAFLFVELTVRNDDTKARMVPPLCLVDGDGAVYQASPHGWAVEGSIGVFDSLNPSVSKQGFVVFDVPQDRTYRLKLSGGYWSLEDAYVGLNPKISRSAAQAEEQQRRERELAAERARQAEERRKAEEKRRAEEEAAKWRTWTDSTGKYSVEAKFSGVAFGTVKLIKRDGTVVKLPLERLSEEDQNWINARAKRR